VPSLVGYNASGNETLLLLNATLVGSGGEGGFNVTVTTFPSDFTDPTEIEDYYEDPTKIPRPQKSPAKSSNQDKSSNDNTNTQPPATSDVASTAACLVLGTLIGFWATAVVHVL
jgi:hypothetical protein